MKAVLVVAVDLPDERLAENPAKETVKALGEALKKAEIPHATEITICIKDTREKVLKAAHEEEQG